MYFHGSLLKLIDVELIVLIVQSQGIGAIDLDQEKRTEGQEEAMIDDPQNHPEDESRVCKFYLSIAC